MIREVLLLVEKCSHCFSSYDLANGERIASVALPDYPHEFVTDAANRFAYVGHYGVEHSGISGPGGHSIFQIDIHASRLVRTIDLSPFNRIHGLQIDEHDRLYALSEEKRRCSCSTIRRPTPRPNAPCPAVASRATCSR